MSDAEMRAHVEKLRDPHRIDPLADAIESANAHGDKPVVKGWRKGKPNIVGSRELSPGAADRKSVV